MGNWVKLFVIYAFFYRQGSWGNIFDIMCDKNTRRVGLLLGYIWDKDTNNIESNKN